MNANNTLHLETTKKGSSLLFVVIITGCILSATMSYWCSSSRNYDLIIERIRYEQRFRLTEGAVKYGIMYVHRYFDELHNEHERLLDLNEYAHLLDDTYRMQITFFSQKESILIKAVLYANHEKVFGMQCRVQKGDTHSFTVSGWHIGY